MEQFINELSEKRPKYTIKEREHELVITLDGKHNVSLNEIMIHEAKKFDAYDKLIDFVDVEMDKLINKYKSGTK